jgi:hypothetical protein
LDSAATTRNPRRRFLEETNAAYAALQQDKAEWERFQQEQAEWDVTLLDGLDPDEQRRSDGIERILA